MPSASTWTSSQPVSAWQPLGPQLADSVWGKPRLGLPRGLLTRWQALEEEGQREHRGGSAMLP